MSVVRARAWATLAALALVTLALGARPGPAAVDLTDRTAAAEPLDLAIRGLPGLLLRFDVARHDALFSAPKAAADPPLFAWFVDQVGACDPATPMFRRSALNARYLFPCERGEIEAELDLDAATGKIRKLHIGARGKAPPARVRQAADDALALMTRWDRDVFSRRFSSKFEIDEFAPFLAEFRDRWGACRIAAVDLGSRAGALYDLDCAGGRRLMIVGVREDGRISRFVLTKPFVRRP